MVHWNVEKKTVVLIGKMGNIFSKNKEEGNMTSIFEITGDVQALESLIERLEEEEAPDEERLARLAAFLSLKEKLLADKVDGYVSFYRHLEARAKARKEEAKHLSELARHDQNRMERLKEAVKFVSESLDQPKLEGKTRSITVSTSKRPAIDITDEEAVPMEFKEEVPAYYKAIRADITNYIQATGEIPPGVETRKVVSVRFN